MIRIRTHEVAAAAYAVVKNRESEAFKKQYGALAHKLPGLVLQNGLAQATGFLLAKHKEEHLALLEDLRQVLHQTGSTTRNDGLAFHQEVIGADLRNTMLLTRRTLEAAGWMKRYVQGVLRVGATGDSVGDPKPVDTEGEEN